MSFVVTESKVKSLRQGEPGFTIADGMTVYPRAMIHVLPTCPAHVRDMVNWAVSNGYLKCVAHIFDHEETFNLLKEKL